MTGLGGYDVDAGRGQHESGRPKRNPVPSLLRSLLTDHLDPGYAAAAERRAQSGRTGNRWAERGWQAAAAVVIAVVFAAAVAQARTLAPGDQQTKAVLAASVAAAQRQVDQLAGRRAALTADTDAARRDRLASDAAGQRLLAGLDDVSLAAATTAVTGPGLTVTLTDPGASPDLSDVSKQRTPGSRQVVLDRDLQLLANALWASGAEAIAVDGVRVGPNVTMRQAGGAILVDNQPVTSPYDVVAIGPPRGMRDGLAATGGLRRLTLLGNAYDVGVAVTESDGLTVPAGNVRDVVHARPLGG
ncbi:DUF881 domain-containing protein [Mycobacterium sp. MYCO198283]|uniref:DUF881 domain-containing protein n=1 Tax=Mycobacterium sp. MYCO198283 TaxID=2883505 RepID=UPI001E45B9AC|nr:DUF881 domain-containing protein [Mycobacterium sp. MYCO198283]MCG5433182.1 DUF881 domain-containing protein [Mycobacterium sp. MYCO198283]